MNVETQPAIYMTEKYGGMNVSQELKLKMLEQEDGQLKRLLLAMLENALLKGVAGKSLYSRTHAGATA